MDDPLLLKAEEYRIHCFCTGRGHYLTSERAETFHLCLGIPVVVTTSVVATSIFATINTIPDLRWKIATGIVSFCASILSALQTFFGFTAVAETHKKAGSNYSKLRKDIELFQLKYSLPDCADPKAELADLTELVRRLSDLALTSPNLEDSFYKRAWREWSTQSASR